MSGAICGTCFDSTNDATVPQCNKPNCPGRETFAPMVLTPNIIAALSRCDKCDNGIQHDWIFCAWCGWQLTDDPLSSDNCQETRPLSENNTSK